MVDPHLMLLLMQRLGPDHVVWDQAAGIRFRRPGLGRVSARIRLDDTRIEQIRAATAAGEPCRPEFVISICDDAGKVVAEVSKTLHVRRKSDRQKPAE